MVSVTIVSRYVGAGPLSVGLNRKIPDGPLYPAEEVSALLKAGGCDKIIVWTKKCSADVQKLSLDAEDLFDLLTEAVSDQRFLGSEWCQQKPYGPWAACDAYALSRREWMPAAHKYIPVEYYLKFAIGKTGQIILLASCHL